VPRVCSADLNWLGHEANYSLRLVVKFMCRAVPPLPHMSSWYRDKLTIYLEQGHMISETVV